MATVDPFTKGAGTSSGSGGALRGKPPIIGPYDQQTGESRGGFGPVGGQGNPPHGLGKGDYHPLKTGPVPSPKRVTSPSDKSQGVE